MTLLCHGVCKLSEEHCLRFESIHFVDLLVDDAVCDALSDGSGCGLVVLPVLSEFFLDVDTKRGKVMEVVGRALHSRIAGLNSPVFLKWVSVKASLDSGFFCCPTLNN